MDLISLMAVLFLNLASGCDAMKAEVQRLSGQDYLVQSWSCLDKHQVLHVWRTWQRSCTAQNGAQYWGRPAMLEDPLNKFTFYVNRFGEVQGGYGATIEQAYLPLCGS